MEFLAGFLFGVLLMMGALIGVIMNSIKEEKP